MLDPGDAVTTLTLPFKRIRTHAANVQGAIVSRTSVALSVSGGRPRRYRTASSLRRGFASRRRRPKRLALARRRKTVIAGKRAEEAGVQFGRDPRSRRRTRKQNAFRGGAGIAGRLDAGSSNGAESAERG